MVVVVFDAWVGGQVEWSDDAVECAASIASIEFEDIVDAFVVDQFIDFPASGRAVGWGFDIAPEQPVVIDVIAVAVVAQFVFEFGGVEDFQFAVCPL